MAKKEDGNDDNRTMTAREEELAAIIRKQRRALEDAPHTSAVEKSASLYASWYRTQRRDALESSDPDRWVRHDLRKKRKMQLRTES